jgi:hypothetical protein
MAVKAIEACSIPDRYSKGPENIFRSQSFQLSSPLVIDNFAEAMLPSKELDNPDVLEYLQVLEVSIA